MSTLHWTRRPNGIQPQTLGALVLVLNTSSLLGSCQAALRFALLRATNWSFLFCAIVLGNVQQYHGCVEAFESFSQSVLRTYSDKRWWAGAAAVRLFKGRRRWRETCLTATVTEQNRANWRSHVVNDRLTKETRAAITRLFGESRLVHSFFSFLRWSFIPEASAALFLSLKEHYVFLLLSVCSSA